MRLIGFRRLLPLLFTVVHIALVLLSVNQQHRVRSDVDVESSYRTVAFQEDTGVPFEPVEPPRLSPTQKLAMLINLPALFAAIPIAAIFVRGEEWRLLCIATAFVPPLWYWIGRWIDVQFGYIQRHLKPDSALRELGRRLSAIATGFLLLVFVASVMPINHHRQGDSYWIGAAGICWTALLFVMSVSAIRRRSSATVSETREV